MYALAIPNLLPPAVLAVTVRQARAVSLERVPLAPRILIAQSEDRASTAHVCRTQPARATAIVALGRRVNLELAFLPVDVLKPATALSASFVYLAPASPARPAPRQLAAHRIRFASMEPVSLSQLVPPTLTAQLELYARMACASRRTHAPSPATVPPGRFVKKDFALPRPNAPRTRIVILAKYVNPVSAIRRAPKASTVLVPPFARAEFASLEGVLPIASVPRPRYALREHVLPKLVQPIPTVVLVKYVSLDCVLLRRRHVPPAPTARLVRHAEAERVLRQLHV